MMNMQDKVAVVTGAASGIGKQIATGILRRTAPRSSSPT
jgi:NAD(P)-dependent dehydrogenase (short-subunit alcohol dehydrogenase family)